ncbi:MAG: cell wall-binding repeat-containing protein [Euzebya sp.]
MRVSYLRVAIGLFVAVLALLLAVALPAGAHEAGTPEFAADAVFLGEELDADGRPSGLDGLVGSTEGRFLIHYQTDPASPDHATAAAAIETARLLEISYADVVERQGWSAPASDGVLGGDDRTDVYLMDLQVEVDSGVLLGNASTDRDNSCDPVPCSGVHGFIRLDNDFDGPGLDEDDARHTTVTHEFFHLVQYAEAFRGMDPWFSEGTANWQSSVVFPNGMLRNEVENFVDEPIPPLTSTDGGHEYSTYVFFRWLADRYAPESIADAMRAGLDVDGHSLAALDGVLRERGTTFAAAFARFAADTVQWNDSERHDFPQEVVDGKPVSYPDVTIRDILVDGDQANLTLDHTTYAVYEVARAEVLDARITVPEDVAASVVIVVVDGDGRQTFAASAESGQGLVSWRGGDSRDPFVAPPRVYVVVVNGDIAAGPIDDMRQREYAADDTPFRLEIDTTPPQTGIVDGGLVGVADPVAQAIATSQAVFADGAANRVVLATSEQFPDALAGAALAGTAGPILFTPFSAELDPRVAEEIARVTGGEGVMLVLGGTAAVTDSAAAQARSASGDVACSTPFPVTCRYAGSGREVTAALIAETVVQEHNRSIALLARGDVFADALTGGAYAARAGVPVLLTPSNQPNVATADFLAAHPEIDQIVVLGGIVAVDQPTATALGATRRVEGPERTATSVAIAEELWAAGGIGTGGSVLVNVRDDDGWTAALSAAVASATFDAPQLGVESPPALLSDAVLAYLQTTDGPVQAFGRVSNAQLDEALGRGP